jgi:hypothetical protein
MPIKRMVTENVVDIYNEILFSYKKNDTLSFELEEIILS